MICYLPRRVDWCENTPSMVTSLVLAPETAPGIETMGDVTYAEMSTSPSTATHEHTARRTRERDTPPARRGEQRGEGQDFVGDGRWAKNVNVVAVVDERSSCAEEGGDEAEDWMES